jgi:hypothetical protein
VGEQFGERHLMAEALTLLTTAAQLVTEQEQPTDWAQLQLLLLAQAALNEGRGSKIFGARARYLM